MRQAVEPYAEVRGLSVSTSSRARCESRCDQRAPWPSCRAANDGSPWPATGTLLPRLATSRLPDDPGRPDPAGGRLSGRARLLAAVLGGAPPKVRPLLDRAWVNGDGVRVALRDGPVLRFGPPVRLAAKWAAATRLLASRAAVGAETIDVRLPERPSVTGFGVAAQETAPAATTEPAATTRPPTPRPSRRSPEPPARRASRNPAHRPRTLNPDSRFATLQRGWSVWALIARYRARRCKGRDFRLCCRIYDSPDRFKRLKPRLSLWLCRQSALPEEK